MRKLLASLFLIITLGTTQGAYAGPFEDAKAAYSRKDYATALSLLRPLAAQGNATAQFVLGMMYNYGQGVVQDRAGSPVRTDIGRLPDVLDLVDVAASEEGIEVLFDCFDDGEWSLGERCTAETVKAGLGRFYFDDDEADVGRGGRDAADLFDADWHWCSGSG